LSDCRLLSAASSVAPFSFCLVAEVFHSTISQGFVLGVFCVLFGFLLLFSCGLSAVFFISVLIWLVMCVGTVEVL